MKRLLLGNEEEEALWNEEMQIITEERERALGKVEGIEH